MTKYIILGLAFGLLDFTSAYSQEVVTASPASSDDYYKSYHDEKSVFGVSAGMGLIDTRIGFVIIPNISHRIVTEGFIPDIVNPVFLEFMFGPFLAEGTTSWIYSGHLRWDFVKNAKWTWFALGGLGGNLMKNSLADRLAIHPRFGIGFMREYETFIVRGDFSHEQITFGFAYPF
jgi:hypothetical protein